MSFFYFKLYKFSINALNNCMMKNYELLSEDNTSKKVFLNVDKNKRTALVVGGSSGIGCEIVKGLLDKNYNVVNLSRTNCPLSRVININVDVTNESLIKKAMDEVIENCPYISILVYSAGFSMASPIELSKSEDYRYLFEVNYFSVINCLQLIIPYFKKRGGRIILISSIGAQIPIVFNGFYSSSKSSLDMLAKSLYLELKKYRIKITSVQVGGTATDFTFKRKVYSVEENGSYASSLKRSVVSLASEEQGGMKPSTVAQKIVKLIDKKQPPITTAIGVKNKVFLLMNKVLPEKTSMFLISKFFNQ